MTANGWLQILFFCAVSCRREAARASISSAVYEARSAGSRPSSARSTAPAASIPDEDQHWTRYAAAHAALQRGLMLLTYACCGCSTCFRSTRRASPPCRTGRRSRRRPRSPRNTNWQSYAGESTMSYFSQMTQLAFHNFVSAAVGMALAVALVRGHRPPLGRAGSATSGPISSAARSTCCSRSRSCSSLVFVQQGVIQNFEPYVERHHARGREADPRDGAGREPGGHQAARHQRRRLLQRQRGASVREPDAVDELPVDVRDLR